MSVYFANDAVRAEATVMVTATTQTDDARPERLPADATEKLLKAIFGTGGSAAGVEIRLSAVETRVGHVETRLAVVETKLGTLGSSVARVEASVLRLQENARTDLRRGALIATALGLAGMMAKGFHWI